MSAAPRILLRSVFAPHTGYGNDGIGLVKALLDEGWDVTIDPESVAPPLPSYVAALLTKPIEGPFDVLLHHAWPDNLVLSESVRTVARRVVAWTMWEFTTLSEKWVNNPWSTYDALIGYDDTSVKALGQVFEGPILKLQGGYWSEEWRTPGDAIPERDWSGPIKFGMVGMLNQRKNPFATIRAFEKLRQQYGEKVELHLKTGVAVLHPKIAERYPGVHIYTATWPRHLLKDFYGALHCLVAPSWGEGKNLPALEAMTTGIPVIASATGGHLEWADPDWTYLVPGTWAEHQPGYESFRVDEDALLAAMVEVVEHPEEAARKGALASRVIPAQCDWSKVVMRLREVLKEVPEHSLPTAF